MYRQSPNIIEKVTNSLPLDVPRAVLVADSTAQELIRYQLRSGLNVVNGEFATVEFTCDCTASEFEHLTTATGDADLIIGASGTRATDVSKTVYVECSIPHISIPIITLIDALTSGLFILYDEEDEFDQFALYNIYSIIVFVDTAIIASAPTCYLRCGMVDALGEQ